MAYSGTLLDAAMAQAPTQNEVQSVVLTGSPTGGTFTLTFEGQTTAGIAYNASAATVDAALEALSNIGAGEVTCAGGPLPGTAVTVTFSGTLGESNRTQMTGDESGLTGGSSPAVSVTTPTGGYGAQKTALNAGIDTLGALIDTHASAMSAVEVQAMHEHLYKLGDMIANALRDQTS